MQENSLRRMQDADILYKRIVAMSSSFLNGDTIGDVERFKKEATLLINGIRGTDAVIGIFDHLLKKGFRHYWIRISYGEENEYVHTFHSQDKLYSTKDLLSVREKEILNLVADDCDTKEIAERLFISTATVGNHRSNMIEKMGARDSTAMVQLAKMADII